MGKILWMTPKQKEAHDRMVHRADHQEGGACAWGFSNVKYLDHSGGHGKAGRRKRNGWKKGWHKDFMRRLGHK